MVINDLKKKVMSDLLEQQSCNKITTLDFKNALILHHPDFYWTQNEVSTFLAEKNLPYEDNGVYRTYMLRNAEFYYSESRKEMVEIATMNPTYVENILKKHYDFYDVIGTLIKEGRSHNLFFLLKRYVETH